MAALATLATLSARSQVAVPAPAARVTDLTGTLSGGAVTRIESKLAVFAGRRGAEIAVLIVPSTQPEDIEQFGTRVVDQWGLGRDRGRGGGLLLLVAKNDRRIRIDASGGLGQAVPGVVADRIVDETLAPHFKAGDYDGGVEAAVDRVIGLADGEPLPEPDRRWDTHGVYDGAWPLLLLIAAAGCAVLGFAVGRMRVPKA